MVQGHIVLFICITWRRLEKHINQIVFTFHQFSFMLVIQLSYSDSVIPVNVTITFLWVRFGLSARERPLASRMNETCESESVQCSVMFTSFWIRNKRCDYLFSLNLNVDLLTLALESLGCIQSRGGTPPPHPREPCTTPTFTFMHLADAFIQSDLQCIQVIHLHSTCVSWESNPQPFAQLTQCSTTEPHRNKTNTGTHHLVC